MMVDYEEFRDKSQRTLVVFLHTELTLGRTFMQSALLAENAGHTDHYVRAKRNAVKTAETVRHFMSQVADRTVRIEIDRQLAELDRLISPRPNRAAG